MRLILLLCLHLPVLLVGSAMAKPMHSWPATILENTRAVVSGTPSGAYGQTVWLDVHAVHWDPAGLFKGRGRIELARSTINAGVDLPIGESAVVLFDATGAPAYAAQPRAPVPPAALARQPLRMRGFYAYNAHLTTPAVVSLAGLLRAVQARRFEERVHLEIALGGSDALRYAGRLVDGQIVDLKGPHPVESAQVSPWAHGVTLRLRGKAPLIARGGFASIAPDGTLVARLIPDEPFLLDRAAVERWRAAGQTRIPLIIERAGATAKLILTGHSQGTLTAGLGVRGAVAGFVRQTESGHRSQSTQRSAGTPPGAGWHVEIATPRGPLWLTIPLAAVDEAPPIHLRDSISLQTQVLLAAQRGPLPVQFSGALVGVGRLSLAP